MKTNEEINALREDEFRNYANEEIQRLTDEVRYLRRIIESMDDGTHVGLP